MSFKGSRELWADTYERAKSYIQGKKSPLYLAKYDTSDPAKEKHLRMPDIPARQVGQGRFR